VDIVSGTAYLVNNDLIANKPQGGTGGPGGTVDRKV
jgi:hypothetical protein